MPIPALTRMLLAEGVRRIIVTTDQVSRYRGRPAGAGRAKSGIATGSSEAQE